MMLSRTQCIDGNRSVSKIQIFAWYFLHELFLLAINKLPGMVAVDVPVEPHNSWSQNPRSSLGSLMKKTMPEKQVA